MVAGTAPVSPVTVAFADAGDPRWRTRVCGVSLIERLLRALARAGLREVHLFQAGDPGLAAHLARGAWVRPALAVRLHREPPRTGTLLARWPGGGSGHAGALWFGAPGLFDPRAIRALAAAPSPCALTDAAPPPVLAGLLPPRHGPWGWSCGPVHLDRAALESLGEPLDDLARRGMEAGRLRALDVSDLDDYLPEQRRRLRPYWFPALAPGQTDPAETALLDYAQKGTLDLPARVHAPVERLLVRRLCQWPVTPNQLTVLSNLVAYAATWALATGRHAAGLGIALAVGVLDGLDGKQARVKQEETPAGEWEHELDYLYENSWWAALAWSLAPVLPASWGWFGLLFGSELATKACRGLVKWRTGRIIDDQSRLDRRLRLVTGRRNVYVWIITAGALLASPAVGFQAACLWAAATAALHVWRAGAILLARPSAVP